MTKNVAIPRFPRPIGDEITVEYLNQLVTIIERTFDEFQVDGGIRGTTLNLTNLPTNAGGLRVNDVYSDSGVLKIVLPNVAYASTFIGRTSIGTVTVTTV